MVSKQEEDHEELGLMISRIGQNWEITVNWKELQRIGQFGTPWLVNLLLKKKTQEEEEEEGEAATADVCAFIVRSTPDSHKTWHHTTQTYQQTHKHRDTDTDRETHRHTNTKTQTSSSCRCFLAANSSSSNSVCLSSSHFCLSSSRWRKSDNSELSAATWWPWVTSSCLQCSSHERFTATNYNNNCYYYYHCYYYYYYYNRLSLNASKTQVLWLGLR